MTIHIPRSPNLRYGQIQITDPILRTNVCNRQVMITAVAKITHWINKQLLKLPDSIHFDLWCITATIGQKSPVLKILETGNLHCCSMRSWTWVPSMCSDDSLLVLKPNRLARHAGVVLYDNYIIIFGLLNLVRVSK